MTKRTIKTIIAVLMLLTVCLYFVSGTYARYTSGVTGNAAVTVAKWAVAFTDGQNALSDNFDLTFTVDTNDNVVSGKIAPATTATATVVADLTGTEVAVDYEAEINEAALETVFGDSAGNVTVSTSAVVNGAPETTGTIDLVDDAAFTAANGTVTITITLEWENTDLTNESDTTVGETAATLTLPVTLTLQQHID